MTSLRELELSDSGELKEVDNLYLEDRSFTGPTLLYINESEIYPNAKIVMRYRDETMEFSPSLSGKDGSPMFPEGIIDGEKVVDWDALVIEEVYPYMIYQKFLYFMGYDPNSGE